VITPTLLTRNDTVRPATTPVLSATRIIPGRQVRHPDWPPRIIIEALPPMSISDTSTTAPGSPGAEQAADVATGLLRKAPPPAPISNVDTAARTTTTPINSPRARAPMVVIG
jgi:hypothetical protein